MAVKFDFSDVDSFFEQGISEIRDIVDKVGNEADEYDVKDGSYQDRTKTLRRSNKHNVEDDCSLTLYNDAASSPRVSLCVQCGKQGFQSEKWRGIIC